MLNKLRFRLASADALPQLTLIAIFCGLFSGGVTLGFRMLVEILQASFLPGHTENYEALSPFFIVLIPTVGGLIVGLLLQLSHEDARKVGIVHVMERLAYHQGYLPLRNAVQQFVGAAICIVSGHSVGREGPSVHLGAASGSLLGQWFKLPNNSMQALIACGTSAAIAASFNTPLAGVIFAMEVVMLEYTVMSFIPVILAAVIGDMMTRIAYGNELTFQVPPLTLTSHFEMVYLLLLGIVIGLCATAFIHLLQMTTVRWKHITLWKRTTIAGLLTGIVGLCVPQIMGIGYDTVNAILLEQIGLWLLLAIALSKLLITALGLGLGLPAGLIAPAYLIGAAIGGVIGVVGNYLFPQDISSYALYAVLGMGAMMGATLQAPLAALTALLEQTANPHLILPGMLVIVISNLIVHSPPLSKPSVFIALMRLRGLDYHYDPMVQALRRVGVASAMQKNFTVLSRHIAANQARQALKNQPMWIVILEDEQLTHILLAADLALYLTENTEEQVDLIDMPGKRLQIKPTHLQATLQEAAEVLEQEKVDALYVENRFRLSKTYSIHGILTREDIEANY